MLTKSQAKAFFLIGTATLAAVFVGLTIDTFQKIPDQTKSVNLTPEAIRGKHLYDKSNCMGCHTLLGEGAYYAPELTKVYDRRGEAFIKAMLKDPEKMYPGQRRMYNFKFSDEQINDLTAFLKWVGQIDTNGFPAKPDLMKLALPNSQNSDSAITVVEYKNRPNVFNQMCIACHTLGGQGGDVGPVLDNIGNVRDLDYFKKWLKDPVSVKPDAKMPTLPLSDEEISELAAFLSTLKGGK